MVGSIDRLFVRCRELVTMADGAERGARRAKDMRRLGVVEDGAVAVRDGRVVATGGTAELRKRFHGAEEVDLDGFVVLPGLIDAATVLDTGDPDAFRRGLDEHAVLGTTAVSIAAGTTQGLELLDVVASEHAVYVHRVIDVDSGDRVAAARGHCDAVRLRFSGAAERSAQRELAATVRAAGLCLRVEADVRSMGGTEMAVAAGAGVVERLDKVSRAGRECLVESGALTVLLPAVTFAERRRGPPVRRMVDAGCAVALGSGHGSGAVAMRCMPAVMGFAATLHGLVAEECVTAATINAAVAIGRDAECGTLHAGKRADLVAFDLDSYRGLVRTPGGNAVALTVVGGEPLVANVHDWEVRP